MNMEQEDNSWLSSMLNNKSIIAASSLMAIGLIGGGYLMGDCLFCSCQWPTKRPNKNRQNRSKGHHKFLWVNR